MIIPITSSLTMVTHYIQASRNKVHIFFWSDSRANSTKKSSCREETGKHSGGAIALQSWSVGLDKSFSTSFVLEIF